MGVLLRGGKLLRGPGGGVLRAGVPDAPPELPTIAVNSPAAVEEGTGNITFTVTLSGVAPADVTVDYATANGTALAGTNYTAASGTLTINQGDTTGTVVVTVLNPSGYHGATAFTLTLSNAACNGNAVTITNAVGTGTINDDEVPTGSHAYFDALVARGDHWKSYSLRDQEQLEDYKNASSVAPWVNYLPGSDTDPHAQDAAKVVVPAFNYTTTLGQDLTSDGTILWLSPGGSQYTGKTMIVDAEIVAVQSPRNGDGSYNILRGQSGTTASAHTAGASMGTATNSLINQVRLPLGTVDGNTYLFTWDGYWTDSYMDSGLSNHKCFQFASGVSEALYLEPQTRFDGGGAGGAPGFDADVHVCAVEMRNYDSMGGGAVYDSGASLTGPNVTGLEPLTPFENRPFIYPNRWTRFWVLWEQNANDYDLMSFWVADEETAPVQVYDALQLDRAAGGQLFNFWLEFNTSTEGHVRGDLRDFVAYIRNFAALINPPSDLSSLLVQPE